MFFTQKYLYLILFRIIMPKYKKSCKFCDLIKKRKNILFENDHIVIMFGRPHHKGHLLVLTRSHEEHLLKLHENTLKSFWFDTIEVCRALNKAIKADLFNIEYLDNWDPHIHMNIYPRFKTDNDFGGPPIIPKKGEKFKEKNLNKKELERFLKEIDKIKKEIE